MAVQGALAGEPLARSEVAISYSYFEKDEIQRANFQFFIESGVGGGETYPLLADTELVVVNNGAKCSPCPLLPVYSDRHRVLNFLPGTSHMWAGHRITLVFRQQNVGMDFGAHNVTLELLRSQRKTFRFYIFLNSSVRGPFYPSYMPAGWQWTQAYTARLLGRVKVVSSSLVCLPDIDASGGGPRVESWAFALDREGLELTVGAGVFAVRTCKLCGEDGVVSGGEYGISRAVLGGNFNLATLQSMYRRDVNWSDPQHWGCNDNVHASRHGTYDGISMHPFETVFVKASWRVGEPHLTAYTRWFAEHAAGLPNTAGALNQALYRYAVSPGAQDPPPVDRCFAVPVSA